MNFENQDNYFIDENDIEIKKIISILETVYDPEFPFLDIYNMGLIYDIKNFEDKIEIIMTLTTPACPAADMIVWNIKDTLEFEFPQKSINTQVVFEPSWNIEMIKDEDLKRMFE